MMEPGAILWSFGTHSADADAAVIEGNRGLYDGVDEAGTYSTARLSRLLAAPVVVIVDCTKASGTVGAVVLGLRSFDPETAMRGVVLNNASAGRHETVIRRAIEQHTDIPVLGAVPRQKKSEFPERHMGLTPFHEHPEVEQAIEAAALISEKHLDLDKLWEIACASPDIPGMQVFPGTGSGEAQDGPVIGVIRDIAFQFYYPDNLEALRQQGARLVEINALQDGSLPEIDALYIGGGFPETQAAALAQNQAFCRSVRTAAEQGLPIYAECGGLIYLGRSLQVEGKAYGMAGVLPLDFVLEKKPQAHGYTVLRARESSVFLDKDVIIKGHEFHYSRVVNASGLSPFAYDVDRGGGIDGKGDGLVYKNVVAAYTHIHALATPQWAPALVRKARAYRTQHESTSRRRVLS
jgi:cobyrinic acid a,c-diamide synthase